MIGGILKIVERDGRQAARREIRKQLAELELSDRRIKEVVAELAELDRIADEAADQHAEETGPIQAELEQVEQRILSRLADRQPSDPADDERRTELLAELSAANTRLEQNLAALRSRRGALERERNTLAAAVVNKQSLINSLTNEQIGHPDLLDQLFVARQSAEWATARMKAAQKKAADLKIAVGNLADDKRNAAARQQLDQKLRRWSMEADAAREQSAAAQAEISRLRQQLIDE